jgi:hypothetical protein
MKILTLMCCLFSLAQTAVASEIHLASHCDTTYRFPKHESVFLVKPNNASSAEERDLPVIRESLIKAGFNLVDSATDARRYVTYYIRTGRAINFTTKIGRSVVEKRVDSNFTSVTLAMFDASKHNSKEQKMIWQAILDAPDKDYEKAATDLVSRLLKLYGKNKIKSESFKPPK